MECEALWALLVEAMTKRIKAAIAATMLAAIHLNERFRRWSFMTIYL